MKNAAIVCNFVLFAFTCVVIATDGLPSEARYMVFTLWTLFTLLLTPAIISRFGTRPGWLSPCRKGATPKDDEKADRLSSTGLVMRIAAIVANIVLLGGICWALVEQYPHPEEEGFIAFVVLMVLTPLLSLVVLIRSTARSGSRGLQVR